MGRHTHSTGIQRGTLPWRLNTSPEFTLGLKLLQEASAPVHLPWMDSASLQGECCTVIGKTRCLLVKSFGRYWCRPAPVA